MGSFRTPLVVALALTAAACEADGFARAFRSDFVKHAPPGTLAPTYRPLRGDWVVRLDRLRQTETTGGVLRVAHATRGRVRVEIAAYGYGGAPGAGAVFGVGAGDSLDGATFVRLDRDGVVVGTLAANADESVSARAPKKLDSYDEHVLVVAADPSAKKLRIEIDGAAVMEDADAPGRLEGGFALLARGAQSFRLASSEVIP